MLAEPRSSLDTARADSYRLRLANTQATGPERQPIVTSFLDGNTCIVGLQWGDEGKGKIVDFIAEQADVVVRYCGGANAGHTVRIGNEKYSTHLLPVGIFRPHIMNVIANGVVLDPEALLSELDEFLAAGLPFPPRIFASATRHMS